MIDPHDDATPGAVAIFAVGNPSRGDDAIGPLLLGRLADWLNGEGLADDFELIEDFQLQIEHALDLHGRRLALFIDAGERTPAPYAFIRIEAGAGASHTTHALTPEAVLAVYRRTEGGEPPPAFVLCMAGCNFGLGEPLTATASSNLQAAMRLLRKLCRRADAAEWLKQQTTPGIGQR